MRNTPRNPRGKGTGPRRAPHARHFALAALAAGAAVLAMWQPVTLEEMFDWGQWLMHHPAAIVGVIIIQAVLFTFALPGSLVLWVVAPFLPPLIAVPILVTGSVLGAFGAYAVAQGLGGDWRPRSGGWLIDLVAQRSDFFTQCALRTLPGCPHWAINYAAGLLRMPLAPFAAAATLGLTIKWSLYATAVHGVSSAADADDALRPGVVLPLVLLAAFLLVGGLLRRRLQARNAPNGDRREVQTPD